MPLAGSIIGGELYPAKVLRDGAVGYWRLGEPSGLVAADAVASPHDSAYTAAGVTFGVAGPLADGTTAVSYNGSTGYSTRANNAAWAFGTGPMSVEFWFKTTMTTYGQILDTKIAGTNNAGFNVDIGGAVGKINFRVANGAAQVGVVAPLTYNDGAWHHFVGTFTRGTPDVLTVHIDGLAKNTGNPAANGWNITPVNTLDFGRYNGTVDPTAMFNGSLAHVALYNVALTPRQVAEHYGLRLAVTSGLRVGGSAVIRQSRHVVGSGGVRIGGSAPIRQSRHVVGSGGVRVGGAGVVRGISVGRQADAIVRVGADDVVVQVAADDVVVRVRADDVVTQVAP
jgi:hypothetical protein